MLILSGLGLIGGVLKLRCTCRHMWRRLQFRWVNVVLMVALLLKSLDPIYVRVGVGNVVLQLRVVESRYMVTLRCLVSLGRTNTLKHNLSVRLRVLQVSFIVVSRLVLYSVIAFCALRSLGVCSALSTLAWPYLSCLKVVDLIVRLRLIRWLKRLLAIRAICNFGGIWAVRTVRPDMVVR